MEWNSKDQTYDRDHHAFRAFHETEAIAFGAMPTREFALDKRGLDAGA